MKSIRVGAGKLVTGAALVAVLAAASHGQDRDGKDGPPEVDPYTAGEAVREREAGYCSLGEPLRLAVDQNSKTVEEVLGKKWMLWAETEHFRIGSTLNGRYPPRGDRAAAEVLEDELDRLRARGLKLPRKVKEIDPWLHLHLHAMRLEELYAEVERTLGVEEGTFPPPPDGPPELPLDRSQPGPYLGAYGKFVVVLFEEEADLARYNARFAGVQQTSSYRFLSAEDDVNLFAAAREPYSTSGKEARWFHCHVVGSALRMLICGYRGYRYNLPLWWLEGWAHWKTRRLDPTYFSPTVAAGQEADTRKDSEWEDKVYGRVKNDYYPKARELMGKLDPRDFQFADHLMAWSRVDYLLSLEDGRPGVYMDQMKALSWESGRNPDSVRETQDRALQEAWGLDPETFDQDWAEWVLETYHPRKRKSRRNAP